MPFKSLSGVMKDMKVSEKAGVRGLGEPQGRGSMLIGHFLKFIFLALRLPQLTVGRSKPSQILLILSMEKDDVLKKILTNHLKGVSERMFQEPGTHCCLEYLHK